MTLREITPCQNSTNRVSDELCNGGGLSETVMVPDRDAYGSEEQYRACIDTVLRSFDAKLDVAKRQQLGYPIFHARDHVDELDLSPLERFSAAALNNVGDPQRAGVFSSHSHPFELGVLHWFAHLFDMHDFWGYVASGGSESNMEALFIARETLPTAMTYISAEAHFSVLKALRVLRMNYEVIATTETGEMDYADLERALNASPYRHAIVVATCGTTMRGAIDSPRKIVDLLASCRITEFYLHVDAALSGIFIPLLDASMLSFTTVPISSICVSGHKFLGVPIPCSTFLVRQKFVEGMTSSQVQYIGSNDLPMACSRNGLYVVDGWPTPRPTNLTHARTHHARILSRAPLYLWLMLSELGRSRIKADAIRCMEYARDMANTLNANGIEAFLNPMSITVVISRRCVSDDFARAWQLACSDSICHVVVMPHIRKATLDSFCDALINDNSNKAVYGSAMKRLGASQSLSPTCVMNLSPDGLRPGETGHHEDSAS